jgi:hypothetical protein
MFSLLSAAEAANGGRENQGSRWERSGEGVGCRRRLCERGDVTFLFSGHDFFFHRLATVTQCDIGKQNSRMKKSAC